MGEEAAPILRAFREKYAWGKISPEKGDADGREQERSDTREHRFRQKGEEGVPWDIPPQNGREKEIGVAAQGQHAARCRDSALRLDLELQTTQPEEGQLSPEKIPE